MSDDDKLRAIRDKFLGDIERTGRAVIGVFPMADSKDPTNDAFVYTVGNGLKDLPELLIVGLFNDSGLLNILSEKMIERGRAFDEGEIVRLHKLPVYVCWAADSVKERYTTHADAIYRGRPYDVMQVILSDQAGLFPWDAGCAAPYSKVVVHRKARTH